MRIEHHIGFRLDVNAEFTAMLTANGVDVDSTKMIQAVTVYEDQPAWKYIAPFVENQTVRSICSMVFSKEELLSAPWLTVRSVWRNGYPSSTSTIEYKQQLYDRESLCDSCGIHPVQIYPFKLKQKPKWGNRHAFMINWVDDELFVDDAFKRVVENANIPGILFWEVTNISGDENISGVYQLKVNNILEKGLIDNQERIQAMCLCDDCGRRKIHLRGRGVLEFKSDIFEKAPGIVKTNEWFGWGCGADQLILINQEVYQLIISNHLEKNLIFEPIRLRK